MLFYAPIFLFYFLPLVLLLTIAARGRYRDSVILVFSVAFYFWAEPRLCLVVLLSAIVDFILCREIDRYRGMRRAKVIVSLGVVLNLVMLFYFKYFDFFVSNVNAVFKLSGISPLPLMGLVLPIGLSFIVFEKITYLVDVFRGHGKPAQSLRSYLLYIFLFPKLLAGPIVKYHDIAAQLITHRLSLDGFVLGFERFLLGLVKKVLIADTVGEVADAVFNLSPTHVGFRSAWLGTICFTLQIFFDFSAYSDMAIGLARIFGFRLLENFNTPYVATSFTDFWRRWHISLSSWIREYLYFSLGGNRKGKARTYLNLWLCFLASGLWHGPSWNFVLWGAYNGVFMIMDKLVWLDFSQRIPRGVNIAVTMFFVMLGWLLFRSTSLGQCLNLVRVMFDPEANADVLYVTANAWAAIGIGVVVCIMPVLPYYRPVVQTWQAFKLSPMLDAVMLTGVGMFAVGKAVTVTFNPFLYFRF